jgi:FtsH-binding integral membrane protein
MEDIQKYNKALIAAIVGGVFIALSHFGVTENTTLGEVAQMVIATLAVYMVPNKKA